MYPEQPDYDTPYLYGISDTAVDQRRCAHCFQHTGTGGQPKCCKCGYGPVITLNWAPTDVRYIPLAVTTCAPPVTWYPWECWR